MTMPPPQQRGGQAEAAILWAVHISGPDDVYAVEDQEIADAAVTMLNWSFRKMGVSDLCRAEVIDWPHGRDSWEAQKGLFRLEALTSAPPAPSVGGWRRIEEDAEVDVPLDTDLLLAWWDEWSEAWKIEANYAGSERGGWRHGRATHWMELPQPPKEKP